MKELEFESTPEESQAKDPTVASAEISFRNIVFKEDYKDLKARWKAGNTWVRFLPKLKGSEYRWLMRLEVIKDMSKTAFVHPKTFDTNYMGPIEEARNWLFNNDKGATRSRANNPDGYKLWTTPVGVAWCVDQGMDEGKRLRLFAESLYNGEYGGNPGLADHLWKEANATDHEPGSDTYGAKVYGDIVHPETGRRVCIRKLEAKDNEYASYSCEIGKHTVPIAEATSLLTQEEKDICCPLENVVYVPTDDEILSMLKRYLSLDHYSAIFGNRFISTAKPSPDEEEEDDQSPALPEKTIPKTTPAPEPDDSDQEDGAEDELPSGKETSQEKPKKVATPSDTDEQDNEKRTEPYSVPECMKMIKTDEGIKTLLRNAHLLGEPQLDFVKTEAKAKNISVD